MSAVRYVRSSFLIGILIAICFASCGVSPRPGASSGLCNGWRLLAMNFVKSPSERGWADLDVFLALENVDASERPDFPLRGWQVSTQEGFEYPMELYFDSRSAMRYWVPQGFRYMALREGDSTTWFAVSGQVADSTSGYRLSTPCGTIDLSETASISFPAEDINERSVPLGEEIQFKEGTFRIVSLDETETPECQEVIATSYWEDCLRIAGSNDSQGYNYSVSPYAIFLIGEDGVLELIGYGGGLSVGPGEPYAEGLVFLDGTDYDYAGKTMLFTFLAEGNGYDTEYAAFRLP